MRKKIITQLWHVLGNNKYAEVAWGTTTPQNIVGAFSYHLNIKLPIGF